MGRGLSDLQKFILRKAGTVEVVFAAEVLQGYFGWEPNADLRTPPLGLSHPGRGPVGGQRFSRRRIGETTYRAGQASVSRACRRLEERGLVARVSGLNWSGVTITDPGRQWLSVNGVSS